MFTLQDIEHCYYHGTVKDFSGSEFIPGSMAALQTCNGVSGIVHLGNETFVIHPFYGGDLSVREFFWGSFFAQWLKNNFQKSRFTTLRAKRVFPVKRFARNNETFLGEFPNILGFLFSILDSFFLQSKHPHVLYEYKDNTPQGCAVTESYSGGYERGKRSHQNPAEDLLQEELFLQDKEKVKRDVRSVKKFIEVALVLDKAMFDKRPHSSRKDVIHDAIQVVNIADLVSGKAKIDMHFSNVGKTTS